MALYTIYATKANLAEYLGVAVADLSADSDRLLRRASEVIKRATLNNIVETNSQHMEAAQLATCAQVEYWNNSGEASAILGQVESFSLGDLSMNMGDVKRQGQVSPRAKMYLSEQGLLYRGINLISKEEQRV